MFKFLALAPPLADMVENVMGWMDIDQIAEDTSYSANIAAWTDHFQDVSATVDFFYFRNYAN